ncbi:hypothetical protein HK097_011271 [Rhizophlyctis rosea]|uniref:BSD domain-containing protein n=1 Tax=Rhizophlyctis rosea TaxID=64517 RepID=A0AAD5SII4_9FUNG|nr:hypothetical protein HK097_011271 [Rhizophlyctis rosea]
MREAVVRGDEAEQSISDATAAEETPQLSVNTAVENIPIEERSPVDETDFVGEIERVAEKAETLLNTFSAGLSNFLSSAVSIVPPTLGEHEEPQRPRKILYDRKSAVLEALKSNPKTYTVDPATSDESTADTSLADRFQTFKATYNAPEHTAAITRLLAENGTVEGLFADLVPSQVSADDFWLRYFFRVGELEREEAARKKLMHDASTEEDAFSWGSDDEDDDTPKDVPPKPIPAPRTEDDSENSTLTPDTSSAIAPQQHIEKAGSDGPGDTENPQTEDTAGVRNNSVPKNSPDPSDSFEVVSNKVASTDGERSESDDWDWE